jgi:hypothetical protein
MQEKLKTQKSYMKKVIFSYEILAIKTINEPKMWENLKSRNTKLCFYCITDIHLS